MTRIIAALLVLTLSGCSSLILRNDDSTMETTGKVATRVILAPVTLGMLELGIYEAKQKEACDAQGGWYFMSRCLEPSERERALALMPMMMNSMNNINANMARPIQVIPPVQQPIYQAPKQCYTSPMGNSYYTTCY